MMDGWYKLHLEQLHWQSDWNGDEVGYPEVPVVGLYTVQFNDKTFSLYIDVENNVILDMWQEDEEG